MGVSWRVASWSSFAWNAGVIVKSQSARPQARTELAGPLGPGRSSHASNQQPSPVCTLALGAT